MKPIATRTRSVTSGGAFDIWHKAMALEAAGQDIIHLELGEPDFDTPPHIMEAAEQAMRNGRTRYDGALGDGTLRREIAKYITESRGVPVPAEQVVVTQGVKGGLFAALFALLESGDEVLVPDPGYPMYHQILELFDSRSVPYPLRPENKFQPLAAEIESLITPRTKCILLNSPANPTGTILSAETMADMAALAIKHDLWVVSDEIYYQIYFSAEPPPSILSYEGMAERTILLDGFSKPYAMTGWRLGFAICPPVLIQPMANIIVCNYSNVAPFIQDAGTAALTGPQDCVQTMLNAYRSRRDLVMRHLDTFEGIDYIYPDGAFYLMLDVRALGDAKLLAEAFLVEGVALLPAASFGSQGEGFLRMAFTASTERLEEALQRMRRVLADWEK